MWRWRGLSAKAYAAIALAVYVAGVGAGQFASGVHSERRLGEGAQVHEIRFNAEVRHTLRDEDGNIVSYIVERQPTDDWPFIGQYEITQYKKDVEVFDSYGYSIPFFGLNIGDVVEIAYDSDSLILDRSPMSFGKGANSVRVVSESRITYVE